jgi:glycosyltransferase involved in cell wall biosynthesis
MISVVIPVHNEEPALLPLYDRLTLVLTALGRPYEVIFVDDASTDHSFELLANLAETDAHLKVVQLRRNFGQTAALAAGFHQAAGEIVVSMDGDLQHAPEDIPALLAKLDEGYDIASGWRKVRVDNAITRRLPSRIANWMMAKVSGIELHDFGTTFKAYRAEILKDVHLYGELHRFIPALASAYGARVAEVPIQNIVRPSGNSHYGLGRTLHVLWDIVTIKFLLSYFTRPMQLFGNLGLLSTLSGTGILGWLVLRKFTVGGDLVLKHGPLMLAGGLLLLAGLMMFCTGLLGEILMRTYFETQGRRIYAVRQIRSRRETRMQGEAR